MGQTCIESCFHLQSDVCYFDQYVNDLFSLQVKQPCTGQQLLITLRLHRLCSRMVPIEMLRIPRQALLTCPKTVIFYKVNLSINEKFVMILTIFCRMKLHYFWQPEKGVVIQPKYYLTTMPTVTSQITWTGYLET